MFANFKTLLRMIKPLYVIAAVCLWIFSSCQSADYKYEAVYRNLPFDMPRVEAPRFPDRTVNLKEFNAVGNGETLCTSAFADAINYNPQNHLAADNKTTCFIFPLKQKTKRLKKRSKQHTKSVIQMLFKSH